MSKYKDRSFESNFEGDLEFIGDVISWISDSGRMLVRGMAWMYLLIPKTAEYLKSSLSKVHILIS